MKHSTLLLITLGLVLALVACRTSSPGVEAGAADYAQPGDLALPPDISTPGDITKKEVLAGKDSPTGRKPRMIWTPHRQAVWNKMVKTNHYWWKRIKAWAGADGIDEAQYATLAFQMTGDKKYARLAWKAAKPIIDAMRPAWEGSNGTREEYIWWVWMYDWLYPGLEQGQRKHFLTFLNTMGDLVLDRVKGTDWGTRTNDSDELIGHYFGLACLALATAPENPRAKEFLSATFDDADVKKPVGGLESTGADFKTMRNAVSYLAKLAHGGEWMESSEYNLGTLKLLLMGNEGVRTAQGGKDSFPEVTALYPDIARALIHRMVPGVEKHGQAYKWGDSEHGHKLKFQQLVSLLGMVAGLVQDDPSVGPYIHYLAEKLVRFNREASMPTFHFFLTYNPYAPLSSLEGLPTSHYAAGQGLLFSRDGWKPNASFFGGHMAARTWVDHENQFFGDFQLFRKGEWALTHPLSYGELRGEHANSMLLAGLSSSREVRTAVSHKVGAKGEFAYLAGVTGGQVSPPNSYGFPPSFLQEWTRSLFYLPSTDGKSDTIVVFDRTNADDPKKLPNYDEYERDHARMAKSPRKQWIIHMPIKPQVAGNKISWKTPGGQRLQAESLLPADRKIVILDEKKIGLSGFIDEEEKKFQARVSPKADRAWDLFLTVVQAHDGVALKNTLIKDGKGVTAGVLVQRPGHDDALLLFSAKPINKKLPNPISREDRSVYRPEVPGLLRQARLLREGYSVKWTSATKKTRVFLMDLDPRRSWAITVDGKASPAKGDRQGMAQLTISGAGAHGLKLSLKK